MRLDVAEPARRPLARCAVRCPRAHVAWTCELSYEMDLREVWPTNAVALGDELRSAGLWRSGDRIVTKPANFKSAPT